MQLPSFVLEEISNVTLLIMSPLWIPKSAVFTEKRLFSSDQSFALRVSFTVTLAVLPPLVEGVLVVVVVAEVCLGVVVVVVVVPLEEPALVNSTVTLLRVTEPERLP